MTAVSILSPASVARAARAAAATSSSVSLDALSNVGTADEPEAVGAYLREKVPPGPVLTLTLANELAPAQPTPPNIELLALAAASNGQYQQAAQPSGGPRSDSYAVHCFSRASRPGSAATS